MNPLQHALNSVAAPEELKARTRSLLSQRRRARHSAVPRLAAVCACLLLALLGVGVWQAGSTPVSYISIDVNPSIELALNRFDRVVGITAYNDEGQELAERLAVQGEPYEEAINALFSDPEFLRFLDTGGEVVFTVVSRRDDVLRAGITGCDAFLTYPSVCYRADSQCLEQAHRNGISVGKYRVYEELSHYDSDVTLEDCHRMTIGELQQELERCCGHGNGHHWEAAASPSASPSPEPSPAPAQTSGGGGYGHGHHGGHHGWDR